MNETAAVKINEKEEDIMSSSDEEKEVIIEKKKETLKEQMDWLTINERDI
jgi:hypothetical protein